MVGLTFLPTWWGGLSVLSHWVEQQGRKISQPSSGWCRSANLPRGGPSWSSSPWFAALRAVLRNVRFGFVQPGRWPMRREMETPPMSVPSVGGDGSSPPGSRSSVDDRHTSAGTTDAGARGQRTCSSPCPRASIRLGLAFRRPPRREILTPRRPCLVLALISAFDSCRTLPRGAVALCHLRHGNLLVGALVVHPQVHGVLRVLKNLLLRRDLKKSGSRRVVNRTGKLRISSLARSTTRLWPEISYTLGYIWGF